MRWHVKTLLALVLVTVLAAPICAESGSAPAGKETEDLILVLLSGEVIRGKISQLDDRYLVVLPTGRVFVPANNVEVICRSLEEAYQLRRSRIGNGQAEEHAELAHWCQRQGLNSQAEEELRIARQLAPNHPLVGLIERRLATSRSSLAESDKSRDKEAEPEATPQQLEDFAAGLPAGTVEAFTRVVQPMLLNRCASAGCHNERSGNEFHLERSRPGVPLGRISTYRNLLATLKLIDASAPDQCELLRPKRCSYRLQTEATLSLSRSSQYSSLVAWVGLLSQQSAGAVAGPFVAEKAGVPETIRSGPPIPSSPAVPGSLPADGVFPSPPSAFTFSTLKEGSHLSTVEPPAMTEQMSSADPFDPAIFNRRFGTASPTSAETSPEDGVPLPNPSFGEVPVGGMPDKGVADPP